ncbi:cell surface glycoprotein 1-like [Zingiber officinale]|uniref:cell surface glycoprotein 1-like n=1 Tax=Zingiber officinale TaxID=94328 RepID=UPI001C4C2899|nr:cell surface glycoprotein 1-like [Zingiber officinale]
MANQPKKKQPFRFWPWNPSTTPRVSGKASSSKLPKTTAPAPSKPPSKRPSLPTSTTPSPSPLSAPSPQERRQPPSTKLSPVSSPTPRDEDPMPEISTVQLSPEEEYIAPPPTPLPTPSPKASPSRQATGKVPQQPTPPSRFSPASSSSPRGSRREDPAATTHMSPTPSQGVHQPQQPTETQEVSQTSTSLQTEMYDKKSKEPKSPTHLQEVLTQESQTTQPPKQVEPDSQLTQPETVSAPELGHTIETMIPTSRAIPKGAPLTEQESKAVQEKRITHPESVANTCTPQLQEKQEMDVEKKEHSEASIHTQANAETVNEKQPTLEERPKHVDVDSTTKDLEVTREISHRSQKTKIANEKIEEKQPDMKASKKGLEEKQKTTLDPEIPRASATRGGHDLQTENKMLNIKHSLQGDSECGISIITLAGENSGASMHIGRRTVDTACSRRGSKIEEHPSAGSKVNDKALMDAPKMASTEVPSISTSVNSNVQSINNSLIHESSCIQEDPGVHMIFSTKPAKFANSNDEVRPIQSLQSAFQTNLAQSLTNQHNIRKGNA